MCILTATKLSCGCTFPHVGSECEYALQNGIPPTECPGSTIRYEDDERLCADCLNHQQQGTDGEESDSKAERSVEGRLHDEKISSTVTLPAEENGSRDEEEDEEDGGDEGDEGDEEDEEELDLKTEKRQLLSVEAAAEEVVVVESDSEEAEVGKDTHEDEVAVETETEEGNREHVEQDINRERETAEESRARIERQRVE